MRIKRWVSGVLAVTVVLGVLPSLISSGLSSAQKAADGRKITPAIRRITESQYRHTIADVFGPGIKINARFEPERREEGLLAVGNAELSLTSSGFEQYFALASSVADQALGEKQRATLVPCQPSNPKQADDQCARKFIEVYGERLYRRPLKEFETLARLKTASIGAERSGDFYAGLKLALVSFLIAPDFLFRIETAEPDPAAPGQYRLNGYTKASRVSFMLWDSGPDQELLAAARDGSIHTDAGIKQHLSRMISSKRFEDGVRAFFTDMLQFDGFENLIKDPAIYPKFNQTVSDSFKEQTLQTVIDLLVRQRRDYRELFTSGETFINRPLAAVYKIPYASTHAWSPYTFPQSSERSGILTHGSFLSLFSHPGTSSPTKRGIKLLEIFLCKPTPEPPADVDFSKVQDTTKGTVRGRLLDHMNNTGCAACHRRTDPPGLALEHFDGLGQLRTMENGAKIDVNGELSGVKFEGAPGLGKVLRENPETCACLVRNVYAYGVGRKPERQSEEYLSRQAKAFAEAGYRLPDLMTQIASSPEFFKVLVPSGAETSPPADPKRPAQKSGGK